MARITHAANVDLRFVDSAFEFLDFGVGAGPGNFARKRFNLFGQGWIGMNGHAQRVAKRVLGRASAAPRGFRGGTGPSVCAFALIFRAVVTPRSLLPPASSRSLRLFDPLN
jgi:hypothetical protein